MAFDFRDLFIFEMANNHQGSVEHGKRIIAELARIAEDKGVRAGVKLQFRDLDTFIHPAHREGSTNKHIGRFQATRLAKEDFGVLVEETRKHGLVTIATPFDEPSVDLLVELGVEVCKIGSCSATDWPLLEKVAESGKPVVFSTGGLTMKDIDDVVSFFDHKGVHHAIMHCVSIYPTPDDAFQLNQIAALCQRYPDKVIGFSSHEQPGDPWPITIAMAKGARIFEKHVGIESDELGGLNAYSADMHLTKHWINSYQIAKRMCGDKTRPESSPVEQQSLNDLKRGVYLVYSVGSDTVLTRDMVYFAMPCHEGQLTSGEWRDGIVTRMRDYADQPLMRLRLNIPNNPWSQVLKTAVHTIKGMLNEAKIALNTDFKAEFSHHYGLAMFPYIGATIIECVNRDYCKKLIIQTPGQRHPAHYHKLKEETFQVLHGDLHVIVDGRHRWMKPGETVLIQRGVWHEFSTDGGAIVEEISTTHHNDDSYYQDPLIKNLERSQRKTIVEHWGRFQC